MTFNEHSIRSQLDNWRFWVGVAYFGIALTVLGLYVLYSKQANESARRIAIQQATSQSQVTTCFNQVRNAPIIRGFVDGQKALIENNLITTIQSIEASGPKDPLYHIRLRAKLRLTRAESNIFKLEHLIDTTTPSKESCMKLAAKLHVVASTKESKQ